MKRVKNKNYKCSEEPWWYDNKIKDKDKTDLKYPRSAEGV
jgi:hypothetical protein